MRRPVTAGATEPATRRRGFGGWRRRRTGGGGGAAAAAAGAAAGAANLLARIVALVTWVVVGLIIAGIALVVLDANMSNSLVSAIHDAAKFLVGPFDGIFSPGGHKLTIALNWGLAAVVYFVIGRLVVGLLRR